MKYAFTLAALAAAFSSVSAAGSAWAQCGGRGFTGETSCVSGYYCQYSNDWYSQCVPGKASTSAAPGTTVLTSTTKVTSTKQATMTGHCTLKTTTKAATTYKASSTEAASSTAAVATKVAAASGYPSTSGTKFVIDGTAGYYAGTNSYWIAFLTNNADVDTVMAHLSASGLKILRVWGFNDVTSNPSYGTVYFQSFAGSTPTINTGTDGLQRLDYVVKSASAHGIKLIINFTNNWSDYGGMSAYFTYAGISTNAEWYTSSKAQAQYQAYINAVVSRYVGSDAIFAWELANEPRCSGCATSVVTDWATTTSKYIKSLDSNHMVCMGDEGFGLTTGSDNSYPYQLSEGMDFAANLAIADIDFGTLHLYPESWGTSPTESWGTSWIQTHAEACAAAGKPCLLEEYGVSESSSHCSIESAWQKAAVATAGTGADLFWQDGDALSTGQSANDGFTIYYGSSDWTCLVTDHVAAL